MRFSALSVARLLLALVIASGAGLAAALPELILQTGHSKAVRAVVISPDGRWTATGSFDGTIRIWSTETGRELRVLAGHQGAVNTLACSPDGKTLVSGGNDKTVRIWNVQSGLESAKETGDDTITAIAFDRSGERFAFGDSSGKIALKNIGDKMPSSVVADEKLSGGIAGLAWSPEHTGLGAGFDDGSIRIYDLAGKKPAKLLKAHTQKVRVLCFATADTLISGGDDTQIVVWDVAKARRVALLAGHSAAVIAAAQPAAGKIVSVDANKAIKTWSLSPKTGWAADGTPSDGDSLGASDTAAFSSDVSTVAIGNGDGTATVVDTKTGREMQRLENHTVGFYGVEFSGDGHWLAAPGFDNSVKLWDLRTGDARPSLIGHTGRVTAVAFAPDNRLVSASVDHTLRVWDLLTRRSIAVLAGHEGSVGSVAVGSKGKIAVSASADGSVGLWDLDGKLQPRLLKGHKGEVIAVALSPDETMIASSGMDGTVRLWRADNGAAVSMIDAGAGEVDSVAFSPDGRRVAAGGVDGSIRIWHIAGAQLVATLKGHASRVYSVRFSPDGKSLVSGGQDKSVRIWDVAQAVAVSKIDAHAGPVFGASYSPKGNFIASAGDDGSINIWNSENGSRSTTLISLQGDEWLTVTPQGQFDGSPDSWRQLNWRFDNDTFNIKPVEIFFDEYYQPGLLADVMAGRPLPAVSSISDRDRRQPELRLSAGVTTGRNTAVTINIASAPGGARDVRLFRNGSLVKSWRGDALKGASNALLKADIPIVAGENRLTAYAFNSQNVKSTDATLRVTGAASLARAGTLYIVAVGINSYSNSEFDLRYAVADADDFCNEMASRQSGLGGYGRVEIIRLNDADARKERILGTMAELRSKTLPEDGVIVYFAGHGVAEKDHFYLVPHDLGYDGSRSEIDDDGLRTILSSSISDDELEAAVREIDASQMLLVIDACNSGQVLETEEKRRGPMNTKGIAQLAYEKGMYILTAAQSYQAAKEAAKLGHGFLTFALVEEGLKTNAADDAPRDGEVTLREWLDFAAMRVPQIQQDDIKARELVRDKTAGPPAIDERSIQRPRVFYRREADIKPFVVARY